MRRVLVTGSRNWADQEAVFNALRVTNADATVMADAAIAELRPLLEAWVRIGVTGGDMTPAAARILNRILEGDL